MGYIVYVTKVYPNVVFAEIEIQLIQFWPVGLVKDYDSGMNRVILLEPTDEILLEHNARGLPVSFLVNPDGKVIYRELGEIQPEEFDQWLEANVLMEDLP